MAKKKNAGASSSTSSKDVAALAAAALTPDASPPLKSTSLPDDPSFDAAASSLTSSSSPATTTTTTTTTDDSSKLIRVNNANIIELKHAVDDSVKEFFSRDFTRSHIHEDMRIGLGWSAVIVSLATGYYGYVTEFHQSRFWCSVGVSIYMILNSLYWLYVNYVERDIIFEGKRRTFASRISTEKLVISSTASSLPQPSPSSFPFSLFSSKTTSSPPSPPPLKNSAAAFPNYTLSISYVHSSNNGKSLIRSHQVDVTRCFGEWFDRQGTLAKGVLEAQLGDLMKECVEG